MDAIRDRICIYMRDVVGIEPELIPSLRQKYVQDFGTTFVGLKKFFGIDEEDYLTFVHNFDFKHYLKRDGHLEALLSGYSQRKIIFTNADTRHALRILEYLDVRHYFDLIIDVHQSKPFVKPHPDAFKKALDLLGYSSWEGCIFLDDQLPNVEKAEEIGLFAILVDEEMKADFHRKIPSIMRLPEFLPVDKH